MGKDLDNLGTYPQWTTGGDFTSMSQLGRDSDSDRIAQRAARECANQQGGTNNDNLLSELSSQYPGEREADDLTGYNSIDDDLYHTSGEWQQRQWKESDDTGGEGVPAPDMPLFIVPTPPRKPHKPY